MTNEDIEETLKELNDLKHLSSQARELIILLNKAVFKKENELLTLKNNLK